MHFHTESREPGLGGIPTSAKLQKITPELQTEQVSPVGSVVSRVKGKHHDGGALRWTVFFRQFKWYREPIRPVWMNGFFVFRKQQIQAVPGNSFHNKNHQTKTTARRQKIF